jgi:hypothetical protein
MSKILTFNGTSKIDYQMYYMIIGKYCIVLMFIINEWYNTVMVEY